MRKQFFFQSGQKKLFGSLHLPERCQLDFGIIFLHPFAEEKVISHKALVNLAESLQRENIASFRFDFIGNGDSEGDFQEFTIGKALENLQDAMTIFKTETGIDIQRIALLGLRMGGTISLIAGARMLDVENVIAISPIIDGSSYFNMLLRSHLAYQMSTYKKIRKNREMLIDELERNILLNIDGYLISRSLYKQLTAINLFNIEPDNLKYVALIGLLGENKKQLDELLKLDNLLRSKNVISETTYVKDNSVWKASGVYDMSLENTTNCILKWIDKFFR